MLDFDFFRKGSRSRPARHFVYDLSRKILLILYSINRPNFMALLPLRLEILSNICIIIICFSVYEVMNFEISLSFLISSFSI